MGNDAGAGGGGVVLVLVLVFDGGGEDQKAEDEGAGVGAEEMLMELIGTAAASRRSLRLDRNAVVASAPAAALAPATATRVFMGIFW